VITLGCGEKILARKFLWAVIFIKINNMKSIIKKIANFIAYFTFFLPLAALAQTDQVGRGLDRIGGVFPNGGAGSISGSRSLTDLLMSIIQLMLIFAGIIAVAFIIVGGYWYITSAGNEEQAEKGKGTLVNAIIGVVIVILSYVIVGIVSNLVGNDRF
jgi:hypothetical protein